MEKRLALPVKHRIHTFIKVRILHSTLLQRLFLSRPQKPKKFEKKYLQFDNRGEYIIHYSQIIHLGKVFDFSILGEEFLTL